MKFFIFGSNFVLSPAAFSEVKISLAVLRHPQSMFFRARDKVSYPYKSRGKIIVLRILIFLYKLFMLKRDLIVESNY
jgi:hypothetical protein